MKDPLEVRFYRAAIEGVQWRWPVSKPLVDGLGRGLFEVRSKVDGVNYRVLFCIKGATLVLLHGFVKQDVEKEDP